MLLSGFVPQREPRPCIWRWYRADGRAWGWAPFGHPGTPEPSTPRIRAFGQSGKSVPSTPV